jgi:hypothetical protein
MTQATATAQVTVQLPMVAEIFKRTDLSTKGKRSYYAAHIFWVDENRNITGLCQYELFSNWDLSELKKKLKEVNIEYQATMKGAIA